MGEVMNVLEQLHGELKDKHYTKEETARYLYIRSCEIFSYDPRYQFSLSKKLRAPILNRKIDLENVENRWVVCTSITAEIMAYLLKEFTGIESRIHRFKSHGYISFSEGSKEIVIDPASACDLERVKMHLTTHGYEKDSTELAEIDKEIGYVKDHYKNDEIKTSVENLYGDYTKENGISNFTYDNFYLYKLKLIQNLYHEFHFTEASDASYAVNYLKTKVLSDSDKKLTNGLPLYQIDENGNWHFVDIHIFNLESNRFYALLKIKDEYQIIEIEEEKTRNMIQEMEGPAKELLLARM